MRVAGYHLHIHQMEEKANLKYMEREMGEEHREKKKNNSKDQQLNFKPKPLKSTQQISSH